jgi:hypothetical protein
MFVWQKKVKSLGIPAHRVLLLHRSLCDVQLALPGLPSQQAGAYLCAFSVEKGIHVVVAFHLIESDQLAFYFYDKGEVRQQDGGRVLGEGIDFIESMGFMLGDLDFAQLDLPERVSLWDSLPLRKGVPAPSTPEEAIDKPEPSPTLDKDPVMSQQPERPPAVSAPAPSERETVPAASTADSSKARPVAPAPKAAAGKSVVPSPSSSFSSSEQTSGVTPPAPDADPAPQPPTNQERKRTFMEKLGRLLASS